MQRLYVSANRRYIVSESGKPVFLLGDTAWELFHRCTREEIAWYLDQRQAQGFNFILAVVLPELDMHEPNCYGVTPFTDMDTLTPNEAYFQHIDSVIEMMVERDMYVGLLPTWGDKVNNRRWGTGPMIFNPTNARSYGAWLAERWRDKANLIWVLGGDREPVTHDVDTAPVWRAMAAGIRSAGSDALMTYHPQGWRGSSMWFHYDQWLDFHLWQSGHMQPDIPIWEWITGDYALIPPKPVMDGEPNYEDHPINPFTRQWTPEHGRFTDYDVRKQAYRAVFAGACGHVYGHHSVWQFYTADRQPINFPEPVWQEAVPRPGAYQMKYLRSLIESRPMLNRIPDQSLILTDAGMESQHIRATRADDGSYAMIYLPTANQHVEIALDKLKGDLVQAAWFDPRTGETLSIGNYPAQPTGFVAPSTAPDWVLLLDSIA